MTAHIHIVDDDEPVRESLAFLCRTSDLQATTYDSPLTFLKLVDGLSGDCIVTDVRMPEMDGLTLLEHLQQRGVAIPVIVITGHGDVPMAVAAMKAGAVDFLEKPFDDEVFLATVKKAAARSAAGLAGRPSGPSELEGRLALLSERERQVLERLVEGEPNKIIAYHLGISPRTVEIYRAKVMAKMEAATFADLIRMVVTARSS